MPVRGKLPEIHQVDSQPPIGLGAAENACSDVGLDDLRKKREDVDLKHAKTPERAAQDTLAARFGQGGL